LGCAPRRTSASTNARMDLDKSLIQRRVHAGAARHPPDRRARPQGAPSRPLPSGFTAWASGGVGPDTGSETGPSGRCGDAVRRSTAARAHPSLAPRKPRRHVPRWANATLPRRLAPAAPRRGRLGGGLRPLRGGRPNDPRDARRPPPRRGARAWGDDRAMRHRGSAAAAGPARRAEGDGPPARRGRKPTDVRRGVAADEDAAGMVASRHAPPVHVDAVACGAGARPWLARRRVANRPFHGGAGPDASGMPASRAERGRAPRRPCPALLSHRPVPARGDLV
jgi:hypothetical protein